MLTISSDTVKKYIWMLLLFLFGLNIADVGVHLILIMFLFLMDLRIKREIEIDGTFILIFLFAATYSLFSVYHDQAASLSYYMYFYCLVPVMSYLVGKKILKSSRLGLIEALMLPIYGLAVWGGLNAVFTLRSGELALLSINRQSLNVWTGATIVSSKAASFSYLAACALPALLWIKRVTAGRILILVLIAIAILQTGTRGLMLVFAAVFCISYLYFVKSNQISTEVKNSKLIKAVFLLFIVCIVLSIDLFSITTKITSSTMYLRLTGQAVHDNVGGLLDNNGRFDRYSLFFSQVATHPFGNIDMGGMGSAHNTFLDIYRVGGVIPFALFTLLFFFITKRVYALWIASKGLEIHKEVFLIVAIWIGMLIVFTTESMAALNINVISVYFYIAGISKTLLRNLKSEPM